MKDNEHHIANILEYESRDLVVARSIRYLLGFLARIQVDAIVLGSTAAQAHLPYARRLPGDCDVTIGEAHIAKVQSLAARDERLRFEHHPVACKLFVDDAFYMHLIPEMMRYVDKTTGEIFARVRVSFPERSEARVLSFPTESDGIEVRVPLVEYMFCMNLCPSIDANRFSDTVSILQTRALDPTLVKEFVMREPILGRVVTGRLSALRRIIQKRNPELVSAVDALIP